MISTPGPTELIIILFIVIILFGGSKLAGVGKSLGQAIREFKTSVSGEEETKPAGNPSEKPE
ncbi:MAG: twin-arginine translocase TatA/TatE family subunit [Candidatus Hydrogenedentes bacterium]|nr:twin-arginine translocase TatA/TatE family subunit [Candidatus Hydrogenedentota bacterium]